jgi:hypothetical protein
LQPEILGHVGFRSDEGANLGADIVVQPAHRAPPFRAARTDAAGNPSADLVGNTLGYVSALAASSPPAT